MELERNPGSSMIINNPTVDNQEVECSHLWTDVSEAEGKLSQKCSICGKERILSLS